MTARPPDRLGDFRIERELGRGGFGVVYEAVDTRTGRHVALKVYHAAFGVDREGRERLEREARCASQVAHPNVLPVHRLGEIEGVPYLAMELVDGGSLDRVIALLRPLPLASIRRSTFLAAVHAHLAGRAALPDDVLDTRRGGEDSSHAEAAAWLALQAAEAVDAAHAAGILHRDLKPANLLLRRDGHLYVSDFGLAKDETLATLTRSGEFRGTPQYMSPEQLLADRRTVDARSDVYSLGATLYELLTLQPPFVAGAGTEMVRAVAFQSPVRVSKRNPSVPRDLAVVVHRCLEKDPARRYPTMAALALDLRAFVEHRAIQARPLGRLSRIVDSARRRPLRAAAVLLLVAGIAAIGWTLGGEAVAARAARAAEVRRRTEAATSQRAAVRMLLDDGRLLGAAARLSKLQAQAPDDPATADLAGQLVDRARERLDAVADSIVVRLLPCDPDAVSAQWRAAQALRNGVPGLADRVAEDRALDARLRTAARRVQTIETLSNAHPRSRDLFSADDGRVLRSLEGLWREFTSGAGSLRCTADGETVVLGEGTDYVALGWPRADRPGIDGLVGAPVFPAGPLWFAGYAIDSEVPQFRDLEDHDASGQALLCFRRAPRHESADAPFGASPTDGGSHPALFREKARFAAARGAHALLIVNRHQNAADLDLSPAARSYPVPVFQVSRRLAGTWLRAAGADIDALQDRIDASLRPESLALRLEIGCSRSRIAAVEELVEVLAALWAAHLDRESIGYESDKDKARSVAVAEASIQVLLELPAAATSSVLRQVLTEPQTGRVVEHQAAIAEHMLGRPRPELAGALATALERVGGGNQAHFNLRPTQPFSNYTPSGMEDWLQHVERSATCPHPELLSRFRSGHLGDWLLAALWQADRDAALAEARRLVDRPVFVAVHLLGLEGRSEDLDSIAAVVQARLRGMDDPRIDAGTDVGPFSAVWLRQFGPDEPMLAAADALSAWRHAAGLEVVLEMLEGEMRTTYGTQVDELAVCAGRYGDVPDGAEELFEAVIATEIRDLVRVHVVRLLHRPARWSRVEARAREILSEPQTTTTIRTLEFLRWAPDRPRLAAELRETIDALCEHPDARLQVRAHMALAPREAVAAIVALLSRDASLRVPVEAWLESMRSWLVSDTGDPDRAAALQVAAEVFDPGMLNNLAWGIVRAPGADETMLAAALQMARRAVAITASSAYLNTLAMAEMRSGRHRDAQATVRRSIQVRGGAGVEESAEDYAVLALACWHDGQRDQARRHAARIDELLRGGASADERLLQAEVRRTLDQR